MCSIEEYKEALEIYRSLAKKTPEVFESDLAMAFVNYTILHSNS